MPPRTMVHDIIAHVVNELRMTAASDDYIAERATRQLMMLDARIALGGLLPSEREEL